jgi:8-oxo-dGTP pyrophosphatase MutT (NUDIX family)
VKEVLEETGITCVPERVIAVLDGMRMGFTRIPLYSIVFLCRATGGTLLPHPLETADVGWFAEGELPAMTVGVTQWGDHAFAAIRGERFDVLYDEPRDQPWHQPDGPEADG